MAEWKLVRLGTIILTNQDTYYSKENWQFVNYLDTGNITMNRISKIQYINTSKDELPSRARRKVKSNSIIYSTVRPNQLQSVSAYPSIKPSDIENLEVLLPDIDTQKNIVAILSVIDEKIRQNTEINNNLAA